MAKQAAIADLSLERLIKQVREAYRTFKVAAEEEVKYRDLAARRRLELGRILLEARPRWPERGPNAKGWGDFLRKAGINEDVALVAMKYAGYVDKTFSGGDDKSTGKLPPRMPTLLEAGLDSTPRKGDDEEPGPDRDTWCTPKDLAEALGKFDLDPCSNPRSHIRAEHSFMLERNENGLDVSAVQKRMNIRTGEAWWSSCVFINPPYSDVMPWVEAYKGTRFCFLLKFDPSTKWFAALFECTSFVLFPRGTRIEFEPPPGIKGDSNQFPHALFFAHANDAASAIRALCLPGWTINRKA